MSDTFNDPLNGELIEANPAPRMSPGTLDELYIDEYLDNPSNKTEALRKAAEKAGEVCAVSRQRANQIHRRLQHRIDAGLMRRIMEGATLGYSVLYKMTADEGTGEAVRAKCASLLIEYAGKNKPKNTQEQRPRNDILEEIKQTRLRIAEITGQSPEDLINSAQKNTEKA